MDDEVEGSNGSRDDAVETVEATKRVLDTDDRRPVTPPRDGRGGHERPTIDAASLRGRMFGRYLVLGKLGQGGMGTVLKAHDESLDRAVALKLLHSEAAERHALRLKREAQALAKLSHPNIVHVYEVGELRGQWFIAMELVPGQTLRRWRQAAPRSWQECVRVYLQAGEGLAAAHSVGLVHRDFKPDNCIIDHKGRPKVLDFGLVGGTTLPPDEAVVSEQDREVLRAGSVEASLTSTGTVMGTPAYMPPEQMMGLEADARSDQFAFCVSLYEAIHGERPFEGSSLLELSVAMTMKGVRPPPKAIRVPGALRRILLQGLEVDPARRWPSMEALLGALRPLVTPRRGRWIGLGVGAGLLAVGAGLATGELVDRIERCTGADAELGGIWDDARKQEVGAAILGSGLPFAPGTWERVQAHLDEYADAWTSEHTEACEASTVRGEQSPEVMDLRMGCLHDRKVALREAVRVLAVADPARVENAVGLVTGLPGLSRCSDIEALRAELPPPEDPEVAREVEALRERLAEAGALHDVGEFDEALAVADAVVQRAEAIDYAPLLAEALARRADEHERTNELAKAEADAERAYALGIEHGHARATLYATTELLFAVGYRQARYEAGLQWSKTALALARGAEGGPSAMATVQSHIGLVHYEQGKYDQALEHHLRALAIAEETYGPRHSRLVSYLLNLGLALEALGKPEEAFEQYQRALTIAQEAYGAEHPDVANSLTNIGNTLLRQGKSEAALDHYRRALAIYERDPRHPNLVVSLNAIGVALQTQGRLDEALVYHRRVLAIEQEVAGPRHPKVGNSLNNIGEVLQLQGKLEEAADHYRRAMEIWQEAQGPRHVDIAVALTNLGKTFHAQGKLEEALDHHRRALEIWQEAGSTHVRFVARALDNLANVLLDRGELDDALDHHRRALDVLQEAYGPGHRRLARPHVGMARVALAQHDAKTAREHAEHAVALLEASGTEPGPLAPARFVLAQALWSDPSQRARARTLAEQARDAYAELREAKQDELAAVEQWLTRHPAQ